MNNQLQRKLHNAFLMAALFGFLFPATGVAMTEKSLANSLKKNLNQQGWEAQTQDDGSVIYTKPASIKKAMDDMAETQRRKDQLSSTLKKQGWSTSWTEDGSLILKAKPKPKQKKGKKAAIAKQAVSLPVPDLSGFKYWRTEKGKDGTLQFYPIDALPFKKTKIDTLSASLCEGVQLDTQRIFLPIDHWYKARHVALQWIQKTGMNNVLAGPVRRAFGLHLVGLVESRPPYLVKHVLAIRNYDGRVMMLH